MLKACCTSYPNQSGSAAVYSLLEFMYEKEFGKPLPHIKKTPAGKPYFSGIQDIHFSLSHSRTHVLCAISDKPVGVDIESPRHISERALLFFYSPEESVHFEPLDLWVLKESYIKLIGGNLLMARNIRFSRDGDTIITPDKLCISGLYHIGDCPVAISTFGDYLPNSVELI